MIRLQHKIAENCVRLILLDEFYFVHIPFGSMVKYQFLALFLVDHPPRLFIYSLVLIFACYIVQFLFLSVLAVGLPLAF